MSTYSAVLASSQSVMTEADESWLSTKLNVIVHSSVAVPIRKATAPVVWNAATHGSLAATHGSLAATRPATGNGIAAVVVAVVIAVNKQGQVAKFSGRDQAQFELLEGLIARVIETNGSLREFGELQQEMLFQSQQRNVMLEGAALLHADALLPTLSTPSGLLSRTKNMVKSVLGATDCIVFRAALEGTYMYEMPDDFSAHAFLEPVTGIAGHVITSGASVLHSRDDPDEHFDEFVDQRAVKSTHSLLCVPIVDNDDAVVGCIQVLNATRGKDKVFHSHDAELLQQLAKHLYHAISNTTMLTKLYDSSACLAGSEPAEAEGARESVALMAKYLERTCSAERVHIFVRDGAGLTCRNDFSGLEMNIEAGLGFVGRCAALQQPVCVGNMLKDPSFNPRTDQRDGVVINQALYVPIGSAGDATVVVEVLNKQSGPFDRTDEVVARMVGLHAHSLIAKADQLNRLAEARENALALLTAVQYLYPYTGGTDAILHSAVGQLTLVMSATVRVFLTMFNETGEQMDDVWKCYDKSSSSSVMAVLGVAGSAYRNVAPVNMPCQDVRDIDLVEKQKLNSELLLIDGATHTSAFLCQPLIDNVNKTPIGVLEFRRNEKIGSNQPIQNFSDFEEELAYQISLLIVHSMVHHSKTWSVKEAADKLREQVVSVCVCA